MVDKIVILVTLDQSWQGIYKNGVLVGQGPKEKELGASALWKLFLDEGSQVKEIISYTLIEEDDIIVGSQGNMLDTLIEYMYDYEADFYKDDEEFLEATKAYEDHNSFEDNFDKIKEEIGFEEWLDIEPVSTYEQLEEIVIPTLVRLEAYDELIIIRDKYKK